MCACSRSLALSDDIRSDDAETDYLLIPAYLRCRPWTVHAVLYGRHDRCACADCARPATPGTVFCREHQPAEPAPVLCWFEQPAFARLLYTAIGLLTGLVLAAQYAHTRGW